MLRRITIEIDLSDEEINQIVPSGTVYVEIVNGDNCHDPVEGRAEIINVKDIK